MSELVEESFDTQSITFTDDEGTIIWGIFSGGTLPHVAIPDAPTKSVYHRNDGAVYVLGEGLNASLQASWSVNPDSSRDDRLTALESGSVDLTAYLMRDLTLLADSLGDEQAHDWQDLFNTIGSVYVDDGADGSGMTLAIMNMAWRDVYVSPSISGLNGVATDWTVAYEGKLGYTNDSNTYYTWMGTGWTEFEAKPKSHNHDDKYTSVKPFQVMQIYGVDDLVIENDKIYKSLVSPNINSAPPSASWVELSKSSEIKDWVAGGSYAQGNVVTFQGIIYRSIQANNSMPPTFTSYWEVISPDTNTVYDDSLLDDRVTALEAVPPSQTDFVKQHEIIAEIANIDSEVAVGQTSSPTSYNTTLQNGDIFTFHFRDSSGNGGRPWNDCILKIDLVRNNYYVWNYGTSYLLVVFDFSNNTVTFRPSVRPVTLADVTITRVRSLALPNLPVDITGMADGDYLKLDLPNKKLIKADSPVGGGSVFGEGFSQVNHWSEAFTNSTTWQQKAELQFNVVANATYRLGWQWMWRYNNVGTDFQARVTLNGNTYILYRKEPKDAGSDQAYQFCGFDYYSQSTASTITLKIEYRSSNTAYTATIWEARIEQFRVS